MLYVGLLLVYISDSEHREMIVINTLNYFENCKILRSNIYHLKRAKFLSICHT